MSIKVLIVDDVDVNRELTSRILEIHGYSVVLADNGNEAIEKSKSELPDIILMDIGLPDIDGWEVTKIIRTYQDTKDIPIIVLTAHDTQAYRKRSVEAGCTGYVTKPIDTDLLITEIQKSINEGK